MSGKHALQSALEAIDGRGYPSYKRIGGAYDLGGPVLFIDHVQGDPFAAPSKLRFRLPLSQSNLPSGCQDGVRKRALCDHLARRLASELARLPRGRGSGRSGEVSVDAPGAEVLERATVALTPQWVEARLSVGLPAQGRRVLGREAAALLTDRLPAAVQAAFRCDVPQALRFVDTVDNHAHLQSQLQERDLVAFIANGAVLPRASGVSQRPMHGAQLVPFCSPPSLQVQLELRCPIDGQDSLQGMGIPCGLSLIVGGGYHGKSTLLTAIERGVYPHPPGDGREYVATLPSALKIRAEDGRRIEHTDISGYIGALPGGRDTRAFRTEDASGSTSQAANLVEGVEAGARCLLIDEDSSATNFLLRDARMQALVAEAEEPITPFIDRVRELYTGQGVSTLLVTGASGDYFELADTVIRMRDYAASERTDQAKQIAAEQPSLRKAEVSRPLSPPRPRVPQARSFSARRKGRDGKIDVFGRELRFGETSVDLSGLEQLVDGSQLRAIGRAIHWLAGEAMGSGRSLAALLDDLDARLDAEGLELLSPARRGAHPGHLARPRRLEIAQAINRLRGTVLLPLEAEDA